jgi:hypothetical protein
MAAHRGSCFPPFRAKCARKDGARRGVVGWKGPARVWKPALQPVWRPAIQPEVCGSHPLLRKRWGTERSGGLEKAIAGLETRTTAGLETGDTTGGLWFPPFAAQKVGHGEKWWGGKGQRGFGNPHYGRSGDRRYSRRFVVSHPFAQSAREKMGHGEWWWVEGGPGFRGMNAPAPSGGGRD